MLGKNHEFHKRFNEYDIWKVAHNTMGDVFASSKGTHDRLPILLFSFIYASFFWTIWFRPHIFEENKHKNRSNTCGQSNIESGISLSLSRGVHLVYFGIGTWDNGVFYMGVLIFLVDLYAPYYYLII